MPSNFATSPRKPARQCVDALGQDSPSLPALRGRPGAALRARDGAGIPAARARAASPGSGVAVSRSSTCGRLTSRATRPSSCAVRRKDGTPLSAGHQTNVVKAVKTFFRFLYRRGYVLPDPAARLEYPRGETAASADDPDARGSAQDARGAGHADAARGPGPRDPRDLLRDRDPRGRARAASASRRRHSRSGCCAS